MKVFFSTKILVDDTVFSSNIDIIISEIDNARQLMAAVDVFDRTIIIEVRSKMV